MQSEMFLKIGRFVRASTFLLGGVLATALVVGCDERGAASKEPIRWVKVDPNLIPVVVPRQSAPGRTPIWIAKRGDKQLTVFGTVHAIRPGTNWAPPELLEACPKADLVFLEEPDLKPSEAEALKVLVPPTPPWKDLTANERDRLAEILKRLKLGLSDYQAVDAGRMVLHAESLISMSRGQGGRPDVEKWAAVSCARSGQKLRALEPAGTYTRIIMSLPPAKRTEMLRGFVAQPAKHPEIQASLYDAWARGDNPEIDRLSGLDSARWSSLGIADKVLKDRNALWTTTIKHAMSENDSVLVVVGLAHTTGPDNLITALQKEGIALKLAPPPQPAQQ